MIAWELTRSCNLACVHCRASAERGPYPGELSTQEVLKVMDEIALVGKPVIILTGGEPLLRSDIFDLARHGTEKGLRMVMATNGTLFIGRNGPEDEGFRDSTDQYQPRWPESRDP